MSPGQKIEAITSGLSCNLSFFWKCDGIISKPLKMGATYFSRIYQKPRANSLIIDAITVKCSIQFVLPQPVS